MDSQSIRLKESAAKHARAIREKLRVLKGQQFETQRVMSEALQPVTEPLHDILEIQKKNNTTTTSDRKEIQKKNNYDTNDQKNEKILSYLHKVRKNDKSEIDTVYGVRYEDGSYMLGNKIIDFINDKVRVGEEMYDATPGLSDLLFKKIPEMHDYTEEDLVTYSKILKASQVHRRNYSRNGQLRSGNSYKYKKVIRPLVKNHKGLGLQWKEHQPDTKQDYIYWNDPNDLVNRLRLLVASRDAGNNNHTQEIEEIIQELKSARIIA